MRRIVRKSKLRLEPLEPREVPSANLVVNPGLETDNGGQPDSWQGNSWGGTTARFTTVSGLSGASAVRVDVDARTSGDAKWFSTDFAVAPGTTYTFSDRYVSNVLSKNTVRFRMADGSYQYNGFADVPASATAAVNTFQFTAPSGAVSATVFHLLDQVGYLVTDDYSVTSPDSPPPPPPPPPTGSGTNLIANADLSVGGSSPTGWNQSVWGGTAANFSVGNDGPSGSKTLVVNVTNPGSGDAKWFFNDVAVTAGTDVTYSNSYRSNVSSQLVIRFRSAGGSYSYQWVTTLASAADWTNVSQTIRVPSGAVGMTMFHLTSSVGKLEISQSRLELVGTPPPPPPPPTSSGKITLTFDDGWYSQYQNAVPILNAENVDGSFYIISRANMGSQVLDLVSNRSVETLGGSGIPVDWTQHTSGIISADFNLSTTTKSDGARSAGITVSSASGGEAAWLHQPISIIGGRQYSFRHDYNATVATESVVRWTHHDGRYTYTWLANHSATGGSWQNHSRTLTAPGDADAAVLMHLIRGTGNLLVDNYSIQELNRYENPLYMNPDHLLALQAAGHEIGAHTRTHDNLATLSRHGIVGEVIGSRNDLLAFGINNVDTFVYPYGSYDSEVLDVTQEAGFTAARSIIQGYNTSSTDPYLLQTQHFIRTTTMADVNEWVSEAAANGTWLILMFHQIDYNFGDQYGTTPELLQQAIDAAQAAGLQFVTMRDGAATI